MSEPSKPREWTVIGTYSPSFEERYVILDGPSIGITKFKVREVSPEMDAAVEKMREAIGQYQEYFKAIASGEYEKNRRPAPLRDFEVVLQLSGSEALEAFDKAVKRGAE